MTDLLDVLRFQKGLTLNTNNMNNVLVKLAMMKNSFHEHLINEKIGSHTLSKSLHIERMQMTYAAVSGNNYDTHKVNVRTTDSTNNPLLSTIESDTAISKYDVCVEYAAQIKEIFKMRDTFTNYDIVPKYTDDVGGSLSTSDCDIYLVIKN